MDDRARPAAGTGTLDLAGDGTGPAGGVARLGPGAGRAVRISTTSLAATMFAARLPVQDDWYDYINPFGYLGERVGKVVADGWTAMMLGLWNAGLFVLRHVLVFVDSFMTPYLGEDGPAKEIYQVTFWIALSLAVILIFAQLGVAAARHDGESLARAFIGSGQFLGVWMLWLTLAGAIVVAAGGLTRGLLEMLLEIEALSDWDPFGAFSTEDITDGTIATVLGLLGLFIWVAALAMFVVWLGRAAALLVLAATTPISAAGLVSEAGRAWFWKSLRWFLAAAFTPVIMVLIIGLGVSLTTGVITEGTPGIDTDIGTALVGSVLICMSSVAPLGLFRMLAFVDPGTTSGASMRAGLQAQGGMSNFAQNMLGGRSGSDTSSAASTSDNMGRSSGEASAESTGMSRMGSSTAGAGEAAGTSGASATGGSSAGGAGAGSAASTGTAAGVGAGVATGVGAAAGAYVAGMAAFRQVGVSGTSVVGDVANQAGMGHESYQPDFTGHSNGATRPVSGRRGGQVPVPERGGDRDDDPSDEEAG